MGKVHPSNLVIKSKRYDTNCKMFALVWESPYYYCTHSNCGDKLYNRKDTYLMCVFYYKRSLVEDAISRSTSQLFSRMTQEARLNGAKKRQTISGHRRYNRE
ncbi:hypothetical protein K1T71_007395 [Dendrolimus kikuchii]|uniref:Uncharacterized protein n=1 Tax=Dendrolimus kikuchii TaxID=765133 RepID=A0ACC1D0K0_9NEOP|nr:hypothetical protein K1T71_007395 [Dendrolimus kikuchii]